MKKHILPIASMLAALFFSSCLQHETTISLKKDGSGTIVEETRLSAQMLAMMTGFGEEEGEEAQDPLKGMLSEEKAKKRATQLGEGVTFVKAEPVNVGTTKGARITYRFTDINKLRISPNDISNVMNSDLEELDDELAEARDDKEYFVFNYKDGVLSLRPNFTDKDEKPDAKDENAEPDAEDENENAGLENAALMMFADMKLSMKLIIEPGIAETNATHRVDNTITVMELDMNKVMEKPENMKKMKGLDKDNFGKGLDTMEIDGIKAETKPEITIKLK